MLKRMGVALPGIFSGETDALTLMLEGDLLYKYYSGEWVDYYYNQMATYMRLLAQKTPAMQVLEIGAGTGGTTLQLLQSLPVSQGFSYDFTDISSGFFIKAKEVLKAWEHSVHYKKLDIESDPVAQGFEEAKYDLIVASNVLHATKHIETTLKNARKLLKPGGQLMLLEITSPPSYTHLVFGCLPGWWLGSQDNRTEGPCLSGASWLKILKETGFSSAVCVPDAESSIDSTMSVIIATTDNKLSAPATTAFTIISDPSSNLVDASQLQQNIEEAFSSPCEITNWKDTVSPGRICIFVDALASSRLISREEKYFKRLQSILCSSSGAVFLTSGATGDKGVPISAVLAGLSRTIRSENNEDGDDFKSITIDIVSPSDIGQVSSIICQCFFAESKETEFAVRGHTILIPRIIPHTSLDDFLATGAIEEMRPIEQSDMAIKLEFQTVGYLETIRFVPDDLIKGSLAPDEIQIAVKAAGVNFRHVLYALGKFSAAEYAARPAGECSGVVTSVGSDVKDQFQVGDRVVTCGIFNAFTTAVRVPAASTRRIPDSLDFVTAAQFPLTYMTSWYSLVNLGHIRKGDNVLIHSGTGAVGQAAITIAQYFDANVFVTCGNDEKKAFLMAEFGIPEENIYSSKDFRFVKAVLKITSGKGVDIILNSLSGEFITESCRCLAIFGRFIEIGKNDIRSGSKLDMSVFNASTSFIALDLSYVYDLDKEITGELLQRLMDMLCNGKLKRASPVHVRPFSETTDAFRYMSSGQHMGKMVLDMTGSTDLKVTFPDYGQRPVRGSGTYIIAGGLGGLGREICRWMAKQDSVNLVVFSRSKVPSSAAQDLAAEVQKCGAILHIMTCDVSDEAQVRTAIEKCKLNLPPIKGVIQGAMVLRDSPYENMNMNQFSEVVQTKVQGTKHLVKFLPPSSLDFFVILSSIVGIIGGPVQGNYAAASTFQSSYARYLTSIGQPVTALNLGWIQGAGYVEESAIATAFIEEKGMKPVPLNTFLQALSYAITRKPENADQSQLMVGLSHTLRNRYLRVPKFSFVQVRQSLESSPSTSSVGPIATQSIQHTIQNCKSLDEATPFISEKLLEKISSLMAIPLSNLRLEASTSEYGIDSLIAIELKNWMRLELGCNLGTFEILGSNTIANLGELAAQRSRWLAELRSPNTQAGKDKDAPECSKSASQLCLAPSPLFPNNGNMPSLPVPSLDVTTSTLLKSLRLVLSEEEYERSKACVDSFLSPEGQGNILQARLLDRARTTRSWLSDIWVNKKYLERRTPIAPFTNYFACHEIGNTSSASERAACICAAVLEFQAEVENNTLARDRVRDAYADMNQYRNLFNACRIPQKAKDCLVKFNPAANRHIAVIRAGHYFNLSYEHQGQRLDRAQLKAAIDSILEMDLGSAIGIGALTTSNRDIWAEARANLMATSPEAKRSIEEIERSCFVLCLDTEQPKTLEELAAQIWYGNGSNRWFDKPTQWVVTANGRSGYIGEHSVADGGPSVRLNDYVQDFIRKASGRPTNMTSDLDKYSHNVKPIKFPMTDELSKLVLTARSQFEQTTSAEEIVSLSLDRFGQEAIASGKRNANTCIQLILNLAVYRMYGELKPNPEPVSLSTFADGRYTDCSMVTEEVLKFCQLADDPKANQAVRLGAFDAARIAHGKNLSKIADGSVNIEAHLLALKQMLNENEETPELFLDQLSQKSQRWFFNASYLPSNHEFHYGHWQFSEDGFGIGNMIRADRFDLLISTANGRGKELSSHIKKAADDVGIMLGIIS